MIAVRKRKLKDSGENWNRWAQNSHNERLRQVKVINRLSEPEYAEQTFPRIYRVTRKEKG